MMPDSGNSSSQHQGSRAGTKNVAAVVGVVMLKTRFPRFIGDIGNPQTFESQGLEVCYEVVDVATVDAVVTDSGINQLVADALLAAVVRLNRQGVDLVLTSCGFLAEMQQQLQAASTVPVLASSLAALPMLRAAYGESAKLGIMTFDSRKLSLHHIQSVPLRSDHFVQETQTLVIAGMENATAFHHMISNDQPEADFDLLLEEVRLQARLLGSRNIKAVVLECTNLSPFRESIEQELHVPVVDLVKLGRLFLAGN